MIQVLNVALTVVVALSAIIFLAYVGLYYFDFGLFAVLPESVTGFFTTNAFLQYVALATFIGAVIAKVRVGAALRDRRPSSPRSNGS